MSLIDMWNGTQAGCSASPQYGYFATLPPDKYRVIYSVGGTRNSLSFWWPVIADFQNSSPPQRVRMFFNDKPPGGSNTDPIASVQAYLGACGSAGTALGTSRWFQAVLLDVLSDPYSGANPDWVHVQRYGDNSDSFGLVRMGMPLP